MAKSTTAKKLPKGIILRDNGLYMGSFCYHGERNYVYDRTLKGVVQKLEDLKYEMKHGTFAKLQNLSLNSWFDIWIEEYKKNTVKNGTYTNYKKHYNHNIRKGLGKKMLVDIRTEHIIKFYNELVNEGYATSSIKLFSAILSGCFKQAESNGLISKNPVYLATIPKGKERKEKVVFTVEQQEIFMECIKESYLKDFFSLALMTGMRNGELRGLQWSDIDFKNRVIHVNHTLNYAKDKGHYLDEPKTKCSKRVIPMIDQCYELLRKLYGLWRNQTIISIKQDDFVFSYGRDKLTRERVTYELNKVIKQMNDKGCVIEHISCHCFRHTFATRAVENGMQPQVLKTIMGHSSLAVTMDLYSHVLPNIKVEEMKRIANLF